jgi:hypothetical protein
MMPQGSGNTPLGIVKYQLVVFDLRRDTDPKQAQGTFNLFLLLQGLGGAIEAFDMEMDREGRRTGRAFLAVAAQYNTDEQCERIASIISARTIGGQAHKCCLISQCPPMDNTRGESRNQRGSQHGRRYNAGSGKPRYFLEDV